MWWLAITAAAGAIAGGVSTWQKGAREKAALKQQKETAWKQYQYGKEHSDARFSIQKNEALDQLAAQRRTLDKQVGLSVDEYNTSLLAQAFGIQDARIQTGSAVGASLAAEGASGVRGSATGDMIRAYANQSLERNIEVQDRQNADSLNRMITGANLTSEAINRETDKWMPGGFRVQEKEAQDAYNRQIAQLGQDNFDWHIEAATPTYLDYFTGIMGGGSSGMSLGYSINNYKNAWYDVGKG